MSTLTLSVEDIRVLGRFARGQTIDKIATALDLLDSDVQDVVDTHAGGHRQRAAEVLAAHERDENTTATVPAAVPLVSTRIPVITAAIEPTDPAGQPAEDTAQDDPEAIDDTAAADQTPAGGVGGNVADPVLRPPAPATASRTRKAKVQPTAAPAPDPTPQSSRATTTAAAAPAVDSTESAGVVRPRDREVREWARANHRECSPLGRVPKHLADAYLAAQDRGAER